MIKLSQHAQYEIARRGIRLAWIEAAVASADWTTHDRDPMLTRSCKVIPEFGSRVLRVVHRPEGAHVLVVTAHFDRGGARR